MKRKIRIRFHLVWLKTCAVTVLGGRLSVRASFHGQFWIWHVLFRYVRYVSFSLDHQHLNLQRSLTQLVSTSNKRSSSGEMKKDQKRVGIYRGNGLDTYLDQRWTVEANLSVAANNSRVATLRLKWNSLCFPWLFPVFAIFPLFLITKNTTFYFVNCLHHPIKATTSSLSLHIMFSHVKLRPEHKCVGKALKWWKFVERWWVKWG